MNRQENKYLWNPEDEMELTRLVDQARLYDQAIGDLLPPSVDTAHVRSVLDVGCGPGVWAINVAQAYPHCQVTGIDISQLMIAYAQAQAHVQAIKNIDFRVMNIFDPNFSQQFDLINIRFGMSFLDRESWPGFLRQCRTLLNPGGHLCVFEGELPTTNSAPVSRFFYWVAQAEHKLKKTFGEGYSVGVVAVLASLLREAGYEDVQTTPYSIDSSYGADIHSSLLQTFLNFSGQLKPLIMRSVGVEEEAFESTIATAQEDMQRESYRAITFNLSVVGTAPLHPSHS